ncbi:hypothetical protein NQD34_013461 [Periophthalmus magnuspinnatus]|nr:hypothetical protein NQD34_013461 [Periophthalmus magnuspinnatus]
MKLSLGILCVLVLWGLQQIQDCRGQALIGSSLPIMAIVGDDVILPCFLQPPRNAAALTFEWTRPDLQPRFVFVWRQNEIRDIKNPQFVNRAFLFQDELKHGNISLKLTNVKPKDSGVYRCFIPALEKETSIKLTVGKFLQTKNSSTIRPSFMKLNLCVCLVYDQNKELEDLTKFGCQLQSTAVKKWVNTHHRVFAQVRMDWADRWLHPPCARFTWRMEPGEP